MALRKQTYAHSTNLGLLYASFFLAIKSFSQLFQTFLSCSQLQTAKNILTILGATASGKTKLAVRVAAALNGEIISADSRQVYRHLNIGTGKDYEDYFFNSTQIPHHLIDIVEPTEKYNVHQFQKDFQSAFSEISNKGKLPILCGGTGLYIDAVLKNHEYTAVPVNENLRDELAKKSLQELQQIFHSLPETSYTNIADLSTAKRTIRAIEISNWLQKNFLQKISTSALASTIIGIDVPREMRRKNIEQRLKTRIEQGLIEEVENLLHNGISQEQLIYFGLEYKFVTQFLTGNFTKEEMTEKLTIAIQQFAKRQMTYFRKMEKDGCVIHWIDGTLPLEKQVQKALAIIN